MTDFTLYYAPGDRPVGEYQAYCDFVGRLNAILKPARLDRRVLLYYPIHDLWEEYLPVPDRLTVPTQSPRAQRLVSSFMRLGQTLQRSQLPFAIIDHEFLAGAKVDADGRLSIADRIYDALFLPDGVQLPAEAEKVVKQFQQRGGRILTDGPSDKALSREAILAAVKPAYRISPSSIEIALGQFARDGRTVLLAVNVSGKEYRGHLVTDTPGDWHVLDPATGVVSPAEIAQPGVPLVLASGQSLVLAQSEE